MPRSRTRHRPTRRPRRTVPPHLLNDMRFESFFDRGHYGTGLRGPHILYHYTTWEAAEKIIRSQRFWATAHDCTNDEEELVYADKTILDVARAVESTANGMARRILHLFGKTYERTRIGAAKRVYLVCFSQECDDLNQWRDYGANGAGVCLGIRLFHIPVPAIPDLTTGIMPIQYGDQPLRAKVEAWQTQLVEALKPAQDVEHNWRLTLDALNVTATAWALATKDPRWKDEHEVRMVFFVRQGRRVTPASLVRPDGRVKRYIEVPLTRLSRIPVEQFIIGPNQDVDSGIERAVKLLADLKYPNPQDRVMRSAASVSGASGTPRAPGYGSGHR